MADDMNVPTQPAQSSDIVTQLSNHPHYAGSQRPCEWCAAAAEIKRLRALLDAIDALHQPDVTGDICDQCVFDWPCQTARLLHPEEARRG